MASRHWSIFIAVTVVMFHGCFYDSNAWFLFDIATADTSGTVDEEHQQQQEQQVRHTL